MGLIYLSNYPYLIQVEDSKVNEIPVLNYYLFDEPGFKRTNLRLKSLPCVAVSTTLPEPDFITALRHNSFFFYIAGTRLYKELSAILGSYSTQIEIFDNSRLNSNFHYFTGTRFYNDLSVMPGSYSI